MASLLCVSFHVSSNVEPGSMLCHIGNRQMASLLCESFRGSSNDSFHYTQYSVQGMAGFFQLVSFLSVSTSVIP